MILLIWIRIRIRDGPQGSGGKECPCSHQSRSDQQERTSPRPLLHPDQWQTLSRSHTPVKGVGTSLLPQRREAQALLSVKQLLNCTWNQNDQRAQHCWAWVGKGQAPSLSLLTDTHVSWGRDPGGSAGIWLCYILFTASQREIVFQPKARCLAHYSTYSFVGKIYPATRNTSKTMETGLESPVCEELFHLLGDWQC